MRQDERRQEFRYEEEAKAAKLARITADKSALLARMVTAAVGKHAGLLARLRVGNEMKHEQVKPDGSKETLTARMGIMTGKHNAYLGSRVGQFPRTPCARLLFQDHGWLTPSFSIADWAVKQAVSVLTVIWSRGVSSASSAYSSGRGKLSLRGPL
eukprot:scaffold2588_cov113-Isochrysis_galbana.AAC.1